MRRSPETKTRSDPYRFMAGDEMREITSDRWVVDMWAARQTRSMLYFGEDDHWVANSTRDELVAAAELVQEQKPIVLIDKRGIPHGFCIS